MSAVEVGNKQYITELLKAGADINFVHENESVLDVARSSAYKEITLFVERLGGKSYKRIQKVVQLR